MPKAARVPCLFTLAVAATACGEPVIATRAEAAPSPSMSTMLAPASCTAPKAGDPRDLIPDGMNAIGQLDVKSLMAGAFGSDLTSAIKGLPEARDALDTMKKCSLPLSSIDALTFGADGQDRIVLVVDAKGIGTDATLDCLRDAAAAKTGKDPWKRSRAACTTALTFDDGATGYALGNDQLVVVAKELDSEVRGRIERRGKTALRGSLKWASSVDMSKTAWVAADVPAITGAAANGIERMSLSVDAAKGLDVGMSLSLASRTEAADLAAKFSTMTAMGPMLGVPSGVTDSLKVDQTGSNIGVEVFVSPSDLRALQALAGGAGAGGPPATGKPGGI